MSSNFSPLIKLDLPSPEEYRKRKVALISGLPFKLSTQRFSQCSSLAGITGQDGSYL
jgi:hypothetical protein